MIFEVDAKKHSPTPPKAKFGNTHLESLCSKPGVTTSEFLFLTAVFNKFQKLVISDVATFQNQGFKLAKNFAPIEQVAVCCYIAVHQARSISEMLQDIKDMRLQLRQKHADLRKNSTVWGTAWTYISSVQTSDNSILGEAPDDSEMGEANDEAPATDPHDEISENDMEMSDVMDDEAEISDNSDDTITLRTHAQQPSM